MNKFKAGDKVRRVGDVDRFVNCYGKDTAIVECADEGCIKIVGGHWWDVKNFELVEPWTVYNNTKPMSELSDEQRGLLFNCHFHGCDMEIEHSDNAWAEVKTPTWIHNGVYRAKQKSERELFVEAVSKVLGYTDLPITKIGGGLFDAGFKAPKGGE